MTKCEVLELFSLVLWAGKSERFSVSFDYDTEFNELDAFLYCSDNKETVELIASVSSRSSDYEELQNTLKNWGDIIRQDVLQEVALGTFYGGKKNEI